MVSIELVDLEFFAYHGVHEEERIMGNNFRVNLRVDGDFQKGVETDSLEGTVNYEILYDIIAAEMHIPSRLLEHVAGRIQSNVIESFPEIKAIRVGIEKLSPPIKGKCKSTKVTLRKEF